MRGLFEWDDVVSNTIGAAIRVCVYGLLEVVIQKRSLSIVTAIFFADVCLSVFINEGNGVEADSTSRAYCFQIDEALFDEELCLSGFAFQYDQPD